MAGHPQLIDLKGRCALLGEVSIPGDKSITHRTLMFGALAEGRSLVRTSTLGRDNFATARIMTQLGARVQLSVVPALRAIADEEGVPYSVSEDGICRIEIEGRGLRGFEKPEKPLDCGNSGTTARLISGILAAQPFESTLIGDESLSRRPFDRIVEPLGEMGGRFSAKHLPLTVYGGELRGLNLISTKASAQVKSAVLLAGLISGNRVTVTEPYQSRDHTERMLSAMGVRLSEREVSGRWQVELLPDQPERLQPLDIEVPGDFSAAAFFLVAGAVFPGSRLLIRGVGFNPTRIGLFSILKRMGADITPVNERDIGGERVCDLRVNSSELHGVEVGARDVVQAIDEIPALAVACAFAQGESSIIGAEELRVKESDRLAMITKLLSDFGVEVKEGPGSLKIAGGLTGPAQNGESAALWRLSGDHRIAMCGALMDLRTRGRAEIMDYRAVETSFPGFASSFGVL